MDAKHHARASCPPCWQTLLILGLLVTGLFASSAKAIVLPPVGEQAQHELYLEFLRASADEDEPGVDPPPLGENPGDHGNIVRLGYRGRVAPKLGLHAILPVVSVQLAELQYDPRADRYRWYEFNETVLGNPYLGVVLLQESSPVELELGIHLPLVSSLEDEALLTAAFGALMDFVESPESFAGEALPLSLRVRNPDLVPGALRIGIDFGTHLWIATGKRDENVFALDGGGLLAYEEAVFHAGLQVRGRLILSGTGELRDRDFYEGRAYVEAQLGRFRPGIQLRSGLSDPFRDYFGLFWGLYLAMDLP